MFFPVVDYHLCLNRCTIISTCRCYLISIFIRINYIVICYLFVEENDRNISCVFTFLDQCRSCCYITYRNCNCRSAFSQHCINLIVLCGLVILSIFDVCFKDSIACICNRFSNIRVEVIRS